MTVMTDIAAGVHDEFLADIEKAVAERLIQVRTQRNVKQFGLGDRVKFNSFCGTKYLHGHEAVVVGIKQKKLTVHLVKPVGRFVRYDAVSGAATPVNVDVPPSIVDLVP